METEATRRDVLKAGSLTLMGFGVLGEIGMERAQGTEQTTGSRGQRTEASEGAGEGRGRGCDGGGVPGGYLRIASAAV